MNNEVCKILALGHFLFKKYAPPKFCTPRAIEVTQIAQTWNFCQHFSTNFRYGFDFLILCLNFELQTFKNACFFKNILFLRGYILHRKYYSLIKLAMLLKYIYEIVMKQYEGGSCSRFWAIMNLMWPIF